MGKTSSPIKLQPAQSQLVAETHYNPYSHSPRKGIERALLQLLSLVYTSMLQEIWPVRFLTPNKAWALLASISTKRKAVRQQYCCSFSSEVVRTLLLKPIAFMRIPSEALSSSGLNTLSLASPAQQASHSSESTGSLYLHLLYSKSCLSIEVRATHRTPSLTHAHFVQKSSLYWKSMTQYIFFFPMVMSSHRQLMQLTFSPPAPVPATPALRDIHLTLLPCANKGFQNKASR